MELFNRHKKFEEDLPELKVHDRVRVSQKSGFSRGSFGTLKYIASDRYYYVRRDGAACDMPFLREELEFVERPNIGYRSREETIAACRNAEDSGELMFSVFEIRQWMAEARSYQTLAEAWERVAKDNGVDLTPKINMEPEV